MVIVMLINNFNPDVKGELRDFRQANVQRGLFDHYNLRVSEKGELRIDDWYIRVGDPPKLQIDDWYARVGAPPNKAIQDFFKRSKEGLVFVIDGNRITEEELRFIDLSFLRVQPRLVVYFEPGVECPEYVRHFMAAADLRWGAISSATGVEQLIVEIDNINNEACKSRAERHAEHRRSRPKLSTEAAAHAPPAVTPPPVTAPAAAASAAADDEEFPDLISPLSLEYPSRPVLTIPTNQYLDLAELKAWVEIHGPECPITHEPLTGYMADNRSRNTLLKKKLISESAWVDPGWPYTFHNFTPEQLALGRGRPEVKTQAAAGSAGVAAQPPAQPCTTNYAEGLRTPAAAPPPGVATAATNLNNGMDDEQALRTALAASMPLAPPAPRPAAAPQPNPERTDAPPRDPSVVRREAQAAEDARRRGAGYGAPAPARDGGLAAERERAALEASERRQIALERQQRAAARPPQPARQASVLAARAVFAPAARSERARTYGVYDQQLKFVIAGDSGVGKSCLLLRYCDDTYTESYISTIGIDFKTVTRELNDQTIKMQIWDTAGQSRHRQSQFDGNTRGTHGVLLCFDLADRASFNNSQGWIDDIRRFYGDSVNIILVGTKADLEERRVVERQEAQAFADEQGIHYTETSAKRDVNVYQPFETLAREILIRLEAQAPFSERQIPALEGLTQEGRDQFCTDYIAWCNRDPERLRAGLDETSAVGRVLAVHFGSVFSRWGDTEPQRRIKAAIEEVGQQQAAQPGPARR